MIGKVFTGGKKRTKRKVLQVRFSYVKWQPIKPDGSLGKIGYSGIAQFHKWCNQGGSSNE